MRNFAKRLAAYETLGNKYSETKKPAILHVSDKLRLHLATLIGIDGFRALLSRSLALAATEVPWLGGVQVKEDGALEGLDERYLQIDPDEFLEGRIVLLAHLFGLLAAFIGENLTLRLIHEIWPKFPLNGLDFGNKR